jgi:hypothetical protein
MTTLVIRENLGDHMKKRILTIMFTLLLSLFVSQPTEAQFVWASLRLKANPSPGFPFPGEFEADRIIALYDTNHNGYIDTFPNADPEEPFPFNYTTNQGFRRGSRIGMPGVFGDSELAFGPFCGDVLVYAQMSENDKVYFVWFAFFFSATA